MTKNTNNTDKLIRFMSIQANQIKKKRKELLDEIGIGYSYAIKNNKNADKAIIGLDFGSGESFSVSQNWRSDNNV